METVNLEEKLNDWIKLKGENGIRQHDANWLADKKYTIGGSSIAIIQNKNPYTNIYNFICERIDLVEHKGDIKIYWGNLFESVIRRYIEYRHDCKVLGSDLYITDGKYVSYSPDGLAVTKPILFDKEIVLFEFKCPFLRLLTKKPPEYYISQIKMGLDLIKIATRGALVEGIFRRCAWKDLNYTPIYDRTLVSASMGNLPDAYGFIGFYFDQNNTAANTSELWTNYGKYYSTFGDKSTNYHSNDLGTSDPYIFDIIMNAYDKKVLNVWYSDISFYYEESVNKADEMHKYSQYCSAGNYINFGVLPWKLFYVTCTYVTKEDNYIQQWMPDIIDTIDLIRECNKPENRDIKLNIYNSYIQKKSNVGFI